jgi:hypothetical protein
MNIAKVNLSQNSVPKGMQAIAAAVIACLLGALFFYAFFSGIENGGATAHVGGSAALAPPLWVFALAGGIAIAVLSLLLFGFAHADASRESAPNPTAISHINALVPQLVQRSARVLLVCAVASACVYTFLVGSADGSATAFRLGSSVPRDPLPWGLGMFAGILLAVWLMLLGYVYADAKRRNMPAGLWTVIAAAVPNVIGFLLYFALRRPVPSFCSQCGQPMDGQHKFCPACGYRRNSTESDAPFDQMTRTAGSARSNLLVAFLTFCMMIFLFNAFSLYRKHDYTGGIVCVVAAAVCVGFSVYSSQAKLNREQ